jgi:hypothetical protein
MRYLLSSLGYSVVIPLRAERRSVQRFGVIDDMI